MPKLIFFRQTLNSTNDHPSTILAIGTSKRPALIMIPSSKPAFDEFKDQRYADWRRIRLAIEHENTLVNHRITWLLTSQGFIVAGIIAVVNEAMKPEGVNKAVACIITALLAFVSHLISRAVHTSLEEADTQIDHLDKWWYSYWAKDIKWEDKSWDDPKTWEGLIEKSRKHGHPEIQGKRRPMKSQKKSTTFRDVAKILQHLSLITIISSIFFLVLFGASAILERVSKREAEQKIHRAEDSQKEYIALHFISSYGCEQLREGGSHSWWWNPSQNLRGSILRHNEIKELLVRKHCKDLGSTPP